MVVHLVYLTVLYEQDYNGFIVLHNRDYSGLPFSLRVQHTNLLKRVTVANGLPSSLHVLVLYIQGYRGLSLLAA